MVAVYGTAWFSESDVYQAIQLGQETWYCIKDGVLQSIIREFSKGHY